MPNNISSRNPSPPTDEITPAVLRFLRTKRVQVATGDDFRAPDAELTKLVRTCLRFCGRLFPWNGFQGVDEPQWGEYQREESRREIVTDWIQERLLAQLEPYDRLTEQEIQAAADRDEFRWLGVRCRQALLKEIRKRKPTDGLFVRAALELSDSVDGDPLSDLLVAPALNIDPNRDPGEPKITVDDIRNEIDRLGLWDVFEEIVCGREGGLTGGEITHRVATRLGITERQARNKIKACRMGAERLARG
jgi:hypothetical protein